MPDTLQPTYTSGDEPSKITLILRFVLPTPIEFLTYTIISAAILCALNLWGLIGVLTGDTAVNAFQVSGVMNSYSNYINRIFGGEFFASASLIVLWGVLGCVAYMGAWVVKTYFTRVYEDFSAENNIQPESQKAAYWKSVAGHNIFFTCTLFVTIVYLIACLTLFIPRCLALFSNGLASWFEWQTIVALLGATLGLILLFQITRILFRLIHNSWKIYFATE